MGAGKIIFGGFLILSGIVILFIFPFLIALGVASIIAGILFIAFNRAEDEIEERVDLKNRGARK